MVDILQKKNEIINILQDIFTEYNRLNETNIQKTAEKDLEMRNMITTIRNQESSESEFLTKFQDLEKENSKLKKQNFEYSELINKLQDKLNEKNNEYENDNKFSIVRNQANVIHSKDMEIERLNKLIINLKGDNFLNKVDKKHKNNLLLIRETDNINIPEKGKKSNSDPDLEINKLTGEENPNFIYENSESEPEPEPEHEPEPESEVEPEPEPESEVEPEPEPEPEVDKDSESDNEEFNNNYKIFTFRNKKYYILIVEGEEKQLLFEYISENKSGKNIGERFKNEKGKYKTKFY